MNTLSSKIERLVSQYEADNPMCSATCILLDAHSYNILKSEVYGDSAVEYELTEFLGLKVGMNFFEYTVVHVS